MSRRQRKEPEMPSLEDNKALTRRFNEEVFNKRNSKYAEEQLADDFVEQSPLPGLGNDKQGAMDTINAVLAGSNDLRFEEIMMIAEGDRVVIQSRSTATDTGGFMPGMPPTNKRYSMDAIDIVTVGEDGRFTEHFGIFDVASVLMQLGLMPTPPGPPAGP
jgi:predicted ester cyclase